MNKAIFLDRDGTINIDPGYLGNPDKVEIYPFVIDVLKKLQIQFGYKIIVISNQAGIARGLISVNDVKRVNNRINKIFSEFQSSIDRFYFCPFHPEFSSKKDCICRKPSPYMIKKAAVDFDIDLSASFMIGDMETDIKSGEKSGVKTILIKHTFSEKELDLIHTSADFFTNNFNAIFTYIISN